MDAPPVVPLDSLAEQLLRVIGGASTAGTPAGSRREGSGFEKAVGETWRRFFELHEPWTEIRRVQIPNQRGPVALEVSNRSVGTQMFIPINAVPQSERYPETSEYFPPAWMQRSFEVSELLESHLGDRLFEFAPPSREDSRLYWGENYPKLYAGKTTNFDFTIALARNGVLTEKMLFEYKYAKSSGESSVDGNAHERLSFQVLEYLEIAPRYTNCSLNVVTSDAFVQYRNKYHPSFHQQSIRLGDAFRAFTMRLASCRSEYVALFRMLSRFLLTGQELPRSLREP